MPEPHILVTGGAGFIGSHVAATLLSEGWRVTVLDNFDSYYDPRVKHANLAGCRMFPGFKLIEADIRRLKPITHELDHYDVIVHLAARPGVRQSLRYPAEYYDCNVAGTENVLQLARQCGVKQFIYASSSSVYGINANVPWREDDRHLLPISPYAATKATSELLGHVYSYQYGIRFVALRFFTVYGPRQRPDLAIHNFARLLAKGLPIPVFGNGQARRDYTFIDDVVHAIRSAIDYTASPFEVFNIGSQRTVSVLEVIETLEQTMGASADIRFEPPQSGDVPQTYANIDKAKALLGYSPGTSFEAGIQQFVEWLHHSPAFQASYIGPKHHLQPAAGMPAPV